MSHDLLPAPSIAARRKAPIPPLSPEDQWRLAWNVSAFRADVLAGLSRVQKTLPPKYFYDAAGSHLFDRICEQPEYYLTRAELEILATHGEDIARRLGPQALVVELGSGSSLKTERLLAKLDAPAGYVPVDVSEEHLKAAAARLRRRHPGLPVLPVRADFTQTFSLPPSAASARHVSVYFPGSTIGNLEPHEAMLLMRKVHRRVAPDGFFLVGVDNKKDPASLERAYNDAAGITAAFNRNILVRIRHELEGDLDPDAFEHVALYNVPAGRIEMHLRSASAHRIRIDSREFSFRRGETILTELSYKYEPQEFIALAERAGFRSETVWQDAGRLFSLHCLRP